ncbi:VENN motif pre-toxin domain-containing protein, partial [Rodentibacter myodis]|uniref:VENN motif pre-toxin domain-containing protein n=1 Tax=Rodentibacter myodis TaxID=1907939 RepID=UPI00117B76AD
LQAAAQNDTTSGLVALASPYVNREIHKMTEGDTAKDKATNLIAHALLSAVEFQVTGKDPLTGAVAGVTGEATAEIIARAYGKPVSELTANEKENISTLSQLAGGLAAAITAKANNVIKENGGGMALAVAGAETAKRAVENNFGFIEAAKNPEYTKELWVKAKADEIVKPIEEQATKDTIKEIKENPVGAIKSVANEVAPHYVSGGVAIYKYSGKFAINLRTLDVFVGGGVSQVPILSGGGISTNLEAGWITNFDQQEKKNLGRSINNVLGGGSIGGTACTAVGYCGSVSVTMPTKQFPKAYISTGGGIGGGYSISTDVMFRVTREK